jgi:outer membrane protein assembly factor BamB
LGFWPRNRRVFRVGRIALLAVVAAVANGAGLTPGEIALAARQEAKRRLEAEWPGWGGPHGDFSSDSRGLAASWPPHGPPRLWVRPLGEGHSSIVVDRGRLYTAYRPATGVQGRHAAEETVIALDAATGKTIWEHRYPASLETMNFSRGAGPHATPRVVGTRLFAAGTNKQFFALDTETGRVLWAHDFVTEYGAPPNQTRFVISAGYAPSPLAYQGLVIAMVGGPKQGVMAFRQDTGHVVWRGGDFPDDITPASPILINVDGQDQLIAVSGDAVHGLDPSTGASLWSFAYPTQAGANVTTPLWTPQDHLLLLPAAWDGGTRALEVRRTGGQTTVKQMWFSNKMRVAFSNVMRVGNHYFGSSGELGPSFLAAVDAYTGDIAWQDRTFLKASFLKADDKIILLDEDGTLALVSFGPDKLTVHARASVATAASLTVPTLVGRTLYLRDRASIMAIDLGQT